MTSTVGPIILGRAQAKAMGHVNFQKIIWPHIQTTCPTTPRKICTLKRQTPEAAPNLSPRESTQATQTKQLRQTLEPVIPQIKWDTDAIELNGKMHKLPITKDYILKEYNDVFKGVGTLPGGPYHIRLKEQYKLVQHPPRSVPIAMQAANRAELNRLVKEGIITEVKECMEWINLIVPVMKSNGSIRLCLDPKDLNKAMVLKNNK